MTQRHRHEPALCGAEIQRKSRSPREKHPARRQNNPLDQPVRSEFTALGNNETGIAEQRKQHSPEGAITTKLGCQHGDIRCRRAAPAKADNRGGT